MNADRLFRTVRRQRENAVKLTNSVRIKLGFATYYQKLGMNLSEKLSIDLFVLKSALAYRFPRFFQQDDASIHLQGAAYTLGLRSGEIVIFEELYHDHIYDRVLSFIPQGGWIVFDIGANVGLFTVQQARRGAHVYAFEPNPDCYRRLSKTIIQNKLAKAVQLFNEAVGFQSGSGMLTVPADPVMMPSLRNSTTTGSIMPSTANPSSQTFSVGITSLDQAVPPLKIERIDLLKIDVEGAEVEVLRGAIETLEITERIMVEYHSQDLRDRINDFLHDHQFSQVLQVDSKYDRNSGLLYFQKQYGA